MTKVGALWQFQCKLSVVVSKRHGQEVGREGAAERRCASPDRGWPQPGLPLHESRRFDSGGNTRRGAELSCARSAPHVARCPAPSRK
jgi:hypothetical protein